jgi:hypothetical protein
VSAVVRVRPKKSRQRIAGPLVDGYQITDGRGAVIWCVTRECADFIAQLLRIAPTTDPNIFRRVNAALHADGRPGVCFPPDAAGDVIGPVFA